MGKRDDSTKRTGATVGLSDLMSSERGRLLDHADDTRREQLRAAERQRAVFRAWNEVCANTREGRHVTGLKYLPETNGLLVYAEAGPWATELSMMREVIRARMAVKGVEVSDLIFKTSRGGYATAAERGTRGTAPLVPDGAKGTVPPVPLTDEESMQLDAAVEPVEDARLKQALRNAMAASVEWKKSESTKKTP